MWEISFVVNNVWYTVVGDRESIGRVKNMVDQYHANEDGLSSREGQLTQVKKVGIR